MSSGEGERPLQTAQQAVDPSDRRRIEAYAVMPDGSRDDAAMAKFCPRTMGGRCMKDESTGACKRCKREMN